jgi:hypothetical protein
MVPVGTMRFCVRASFFPRCRQSILLTFNRRHVQRLKG